MREPRPSAGAAPEPERRPLCVDLDGTLLATDSLHELALVLARERPFDLVRMPFWLAGGRAVLMARLGERVQLDPALLPYRPEVLEALRVARGEGRRCVLVAAADGGVAGVIAAHLGLFEEVLASDGRARLKGRRTAERLVARFGAGGFEYLGDAAADLPVFEAAGSASLVGAGPGFRRRVATQVRVARSLAEPRGPGARLQSWLYALRLHQWVKNLLLFLPLVASHRVFELPVAAAAAQAFLAFGLAASGVYVLNDLSDLAADRAHTTKRRRPFASGALGAGAGVLVALGVIAAGFALALRLPEGFLVALLAYVAANLAYSLFLKRVAIADVVVLAGLYTLRVVAGGAAVGIPPSPWLLAFCLFFFLNLAFLKRYVDLRRLEGEVGAAVAGRDYRAEDLSLIGSMGLAAGYLAVVVLALYVQSDSVARLYRTPAMLWLATLLVVYWTSRAWLVAHRGEMDDDPVVFALRDPVTWGVGVAGLAIGALATLV